MAASSIDMKYVGLTWALPEHAAEIAQLHGTLFNPGWTADSVASTLAHPGSVALLAVAGVPRVTGAFGLAQVAADEAEILSIGVAKPWQRHGIGLKLINGLKRAAVRAGANRMYLELAQSNVAAAGLYAKTGFKETGRRKDYYTKPDGTREDALLLSVALSAADG